MFSKILLTGDRRAVCESMDYREKTGVRPKSPRLWMVEGSYVGQASRLTSSDFHPQARRPRYIAEVKNQSDFGVGHYKFEKERPGKEAGWPRNPRMDKAMN